MSAAEDLAFVRTFGLPRAAYLKPATAPEPPARPLTIEEEIGEIARTEFRPLLIPSGKPREDVTGLVIHSLKVLSDIPGIPLRGVAQRWVYVECQRCKAKRRFAARLDLVKSGNTRSCCYARRGKP
jgi:hypothetical protein